jgi:predicted small secreted protein
MMKKSKILAPVAAVAVALSLAACNAADTASRNISYESDNFKVMRRIVFVNGITDKYLLSIEGLCSITKDKEDNQLEVTCKTGDSEYKKHYLGISDNVTYFVEQMDGSNVDTFHYKVAFRPEELLPDIDLQTSGDEN